VLRLPRGEPLEELSRELKVEAHRLAAWRDEFLAAASKASKLSGLTTARVIGPQAGRAQGRPADHGERGAAGGRRKGAVDPAGEAAQVAMAHHLPVAVVCRVLGAPRSSIYARRAGGQPGRPGPVPPIGDEELVRLVRRVLTDSPLAGEGYRKVRARLRREHGVHVRGKRVLRLLRRGGLPAPQRSVGGAGRIRMTARSSPTGRTGAPGTDATMAWTRADGWAWVFCVVDHSTAEAWAHVAKTGDRFAALQPVYDAVVDHFGGLGADVARGISLRHDWGPGVPLGPLHRVRSAGWASATTPPSWASRSQAAARSAGSAPPGSSACGRSCAARSASSARPWPASSSATTASGWSAGSATAPQKEAYQDATTTAAA
jgi:hypothetical protein